MRAANATCLAECGGTGDGGGRVVCHLTCLARCKPKIGSENLARRMTFVHIIGVNYAHIITPDGGDLYVTEHGLPFLDHLCPMNWYDPAWFSAHRTLLEGSGTVYRLRTKSLAGRAFAGIELVVKWSRVGQDVPFDTFTLNQAINADFNSPFEEFSLVEELRARNYGRKDLRILTQKPLAIYVPPERMQIWQTGRSQYKILSKLSRHPGFEIDILRSYIMLYGWIKGMDAVEGSRRNLLGGGDSRAVLEPLTRRILDELRDRGFMVADHKPAHAILRAIGHGVLRRRDGQIAYALVDYELLSRTPQHEEALRRVARNNYLLLERDRFKKREDAVISPHLTRANILGVDYIFGKTESTGGSLWVVGNDPRLFDYFLPERWRSKQVALSPSGRTWYVRTKDEVHLVWKISRIGDIADGQSPGARVSAMRSHGYNSPFEKFALALEFAARGLPSVLPRAIYATVEREITQASVKDHRRFEQYQHILAPDGRPVLQASSDYVTVWGYWRGWDDQEAPEAPNNWKPIGAGQACAQGLLTEEQLREIVHGHAAILAAAGYEDLNLEPEHILLTYDPASGFKSDANGRIETRHCNFEMVRRQIVSAGGPACGT